MLKFTVYSIMTINNVCISDFNHCCSCVSVQPSLYLYDLSTFQRSIYHKYVDCNIRIYHENILFLQSNSICNETWHPTIIRSNLKINFLFKNITFIFPIILQAKYTSQILSKALNLPLKKSVLNQVNANKWTLLLKFFTTFIYCLAATFFATNKPFVYNGIMRIVRNRLDIISYGYL